ncbi:MAG: adenylate/guanylate cyclase domain-containing protein [Acidimicrobiia bacterium]
MIETLRRLPDIGVAPGDDADLRLQKRAVTMAGLITCLVVLPWTIFHYILGNPQVAIIPTFYMVATLLTLAHFAKYKRITSVQYQQLGMFLVLPVLVHIALGGYVNSSGVVMFSAVVAVGAVSFADSRHPWVWFGLFAGLVIVLVPLDPTLRQWAPELPEWVIISFFAANIISVALISFLSLLTYVRSRNRLAADLEVERERSDRLLLNVLPESIAQRLKDGEHPIADRHEHVGVLFCDIVDFTPLSEQLPADDLVASLNGLFSKFDTLADERGLQKVKTIGDAYMVVSGAPDPGPGLDPLADLALEMLATASTSTLGQRSGVAMRFGMDVGPLVAGVIGESRFIYDVYGDTVNTASRMESNGVPGRVQLSERAARELEQTFEIEPRGEIDIKGKGPTPTFFLGARRS